MPTSSRVARNKKKSIESSASRSKSVAKPEKKTASRAKGKSVKEEARRTSQRGNARQRNQTKSKTRQEESEEEELEEANDNQILYEANTYLIFVDISQEDPMKFKIGRVTKDALVDETQFECDIFEQNGKTMEYKLLAQEQTVLDFTVIMTAAVEVVNETKKKPKKITAIKITKSLFNKAMKLLPTVIQNVRDNMSNDEESDASEESEKAALTQDHATRKIVKIRGVKKAEPPQTQAPAVRRSARSKSKPKPMEIDSSSKPKKTLKVPVIGKKRKREEL